MKIKSLILPSLFLLIIIVLFLLNINKPSVNNIFIDIEEKTVSEVGITLIVNDKNFVKSNVSIKDSYFIYKEKENSWEQIYHFINPVEVYREKIKYPSTVVLNWEKELGKLEKGHYKICYEPIPQQVKEIEFLIE